MSGTSTTPESRSLFDHTAPESRANALAVILREFAHPRATTREGKTNEVDKDVLTVEVTVGDWWRALTALGEFDSAMAASYAEFGNGRLSEGFADELQAIARAVHSVR